jgi:hypothetical protein
MRKGSEGDDNDSPQPVIMKKNAGSTEPAHLRAEEKKR